jgi:hypothetical protein
MKYRAVALAGTGWLLYTASYFLPVAVIFLPLHGWEVVVKPLVPPYQDPEGAAGALFVLATNVPMLMSPLALFARWRRLSAVLPHVMLAVTVLGLVPLAFALAGGDVRFIKVGYYLWSASFALVACGLYIGRHTRVGTI